MALKNRIKFYRDKKGISQQKLADSIGVLRTTLSKIENQKMLPSAGLMVKISWNLQEPLGNIFYIEFNNANIKSLTSTNIVD